MITSDTMCDIKRRALLFARDVQHLMTDERSLRALDTAERYLAGAAPKAEMWDAAHAARDAVAHVTGAGSAANIRAAHAARYARAGNIN